MNRTTRSIQNGVSMSLAVVAASALEDHRGSPFISVNALASVTRRSPSGVAAKLAAGRLPGYKLGPHWFVPVHELEPLGSGAVLQEHRSVRDASASLLLGFPDTLAIVDLERFFGMTRPYLYRVLSCPLLAPIRSPSGIVRAALCDALAAARNTHPPAG